MKKLFVILGIFCTCSALSQESFTFPKDVKPLIATRWGQWYPFNALAPAVEHDGMKVRPAAGCGAVAMAQIVNFHKYPCYSPDGEYEYKWDLMYHRASNDLRNDQIVSVAKLISDCGVSAFTKYGKEESGSSFEKTYERAEASLWIFRLHRYLQPQQIHDRQGRQHLSDDAVQGVGSRTPSAIPGL